jgi:hypothetical protein
MAITQRECLPQPRSAQQLPVHIPVRHISPGHHPPYLQQVVGEEGLLGVLLVWHWRGGEGVVEVVEVSMHGQDVLLLEVFQKRCSQEETLQCLAANKQARRRCRETKSNILPKVCVSAI